MRLLFLWGNAASDSQKLHLIRNYPADTCTTLDRGGIIYGFMMVDVKEQIDYIFVKENISAVSSVKWMDKEDGGYLSDYYPVCAQILLMREV